MTRVLDLGLSSAEAIEFAEAIVSIDVQLPHFAEVDDLRVLLVHKNTKRKLHARSRLGRAYWHADVGVWVRYSCGFAWSGAPPKSKRKLKSSPFFGINRTVLVIAAEPIPQGALVAMGPNGYAVPFSSTELTTVFGVAASDSKPDGSLDVIVDARPTMPP